MIYPEQEGNSWSNGNAKARQYLLNVGSFKFQEIHLTNCNEEVPHVLEVLDGGLRRSIRPLHRVNGILNDLPNQQQALRSHVPEPNRSVYGWCYEGCTTYLGDGAGVDAVEDLAEDEAVAQGRAELLLGRPVR